MKRITVTPRADWQTKVESIGFNWHTPEGKTYWDETAYWSLSVAEAQHIRETVKDGYDMMLDTVEQVIRNRQLPLYGYTESVADLIEKSWEESDSEPSLYGRFNLAYDGTQAKIMSFDGDNPTGLFETSMVQRAWMKDISGNGQFNTLHSRLVDLFRKVYDLNIGGIHITALTGDAGIGTASYLSAVAAEARVQTAYVELDQIGWAGDEDDGYFCDAEDRQIRNLLKLAPLNWMLEGDFGPSLVREAGADQIRLIEPAWRMLASNKRLLADMWTKNEYHPALLNTSTSLTPRIQSLGYAKKPINGIEGQNILLVAADVTTVDETQGNFPNDFFIYQERAKIAEADGNFAVLGGWVVGGEPVALSIRETATPIADANARFVPHLVEG